jgi:hypothetical protein
MRIANQITRQTPVFRLVRFQLLPAYKLAVDRVDERLCFIFWCFRN